MAFIFVNIPSRYLNSGYPGNRGIFPKAAHARTINAMMHFLGFPERVVADDRRRESLLSSRLVRSFAYGNFIYREFR